MKITKVEPVLLSTPKISSEIDRRSFLAAAGIAFLAAEIGFSMDEGHANTMRSELNQSELLPLSKYSTSVIESAIYLLTGTHDGISLTMPGFQRRTGSGTLAGYAVTAVYSTEPDDERGRRDNLDYWKYVFSQKGPKVAVSFDSGKMPGSGSSWGQQNAYIHKGLGCDGVLTNGGVRDIDVFRNIGLSVFSGSLTAAHGNPHIIDFGKTVDIYGAAVSSGDLICVDDHGAIVIPKPLVRNVPEAAEEVLRRTGLVGAYIKRPGLTPEGLADIISKLKPAEPWKPKNK